MHCGRRDGELLSGCGVRASAAIFPARDVVIVRRGFDDGGGFDSARHSADIFAAIEG